MIARKRDPGQGHVGPAREPVGRPEGRGRGLETRRLGAGLEIADFIEAATAALEQRWPGVAVTAFGHVGDGNVHYDVLAGTSADQATHAAGGEGAHLVHQIVAGMGGSISAEHGLGTMKTAEAAPTSRRWNWRP